MSAAFSPIMIDGAFSRNQEPPPSDATSSVVTEVAYTSPLKQPCLGYLGTVIAVPRLPQKRAENVMKFIISQSVKPPTRLSAGCRFRKGTIAGMRRNGQDAPIFQTFAGLLSKREVLPKAGLPVRPGLPVGADAHRKHGRGPQDADGGGSSI